MTDRRPHHARRAPLWLLIGLVLVVGIPFAVGGLWMYTAATAETLHPDASRVPTVLETGTPAPLLPTIQRARQQVQQAIAAQNLPGVSVAVGRNGSLLWAEGFGFADLQTRAPVTPQDRFRIGTASALLTAAGAGLLIEEERLSLDADLRTLLPDLPRSAVPITLRQVMSHTAGLISDGGDESVLFARHCEAPAEAISSFAEQPLHFAPGTEFGYSNYGYILVSAAVEAAAREPFLAFMKTRVFQPLGMHSTEADPRTMTGEGEDFPPVNLVRELFFDPETKPNPNATLTPPPLPNLATSYFPRFAADPQYGLHLMRPLDHSCYGGAAVFLSTPSDLVRFAMALTSGNLLEQRTEALLQEPVRLANGRATPYGLGWRTETLPLHGEPTPALGAVGDVLGGEVATVLVIPTKHLSIAVTANLSYADTQAIARQLAATFTDADGEPSLRVDQQ